MPHKRAKRSAREELRRQRGANLAPGTESLYTEVIPKSASRILNAERIREKWKLKKQRLASENKSRADKRQKIDSEDKTLDSHWKIQPGEPIQHFHRRVEDGMRPIIKTAIHASRAVMRRNGKADMKHVLDAQPDAAKMSASPPNPAKRRLKRERSASPTAKATIPGTRTSAKEFEKASASVPRRLNDVAQAPPSLTALRRGTKTLQQGVDASKRGNVLCLAQRSLMDREREKAIQRYRLLKANQRG